MPFAATWMGLETVILSEGSQRKRDKYHNNLYVEYKIWYKWTYLQDRERLTRRENKIMVTKGEKREEGELGAWHEQMHTTDKQQESDCTAQNSIFSIL